MGPLECVATFEHRGHRITVRYGGAPRGGGADLLGASGFGSAGRFVWIRGDQRHGSPQFYNTLAHEMVHLAGYILHHQGAAADPLWEQLAELVGDLVGEALAHLPSPGEPATYWEQVEAWGDLLDGDDGDGDERGGSDDAQAALEWEPDF